MGAINNAFNRAGWSVLQLASATAKYRAQRNEEGKNKAKQSYNTIASIKKQNNELTKNQEETPKSYFGPGWNISPEKDEQKIADQTVLKQMAQEKAKATSFSELPTVSEQKVLKQMTQERAKATSFGELAGVEEAPAPKQTYISSEEDAYLPIKAENTETNISAKDPEVQGLIQAKQKNALRAAAGQRSQERYQNIKEKLTSIFADYSYIDDAWREISLDPDITDEMIRKAGFTKTQILEEWKNFKDSPTDWMERQNARGEEYGAIGSVADADYLSDFEFGGLLSTYIREKVKGKTLAQQQEEYDLSKAGEEPEEKNKQPSVDDWYTNFGITDNKMSNSDTYKVWQDDSQDDSTEEENDETKKDKGIIF